MSEQFEHISDIGIRGKGKDFKEAFVDAAVGTFSIMADLSFFSNEIEVKIECHSFDREELLVEFLNRLITEAAVLRAIFIDFTIQSMDGKSLKATAFGEKIKTQHKNFLKTEVKAATYSQLKVYQENGGCVAQCVIDV